MQSVAEAADRVRHALGVRLGAAVLAEEVVLVGRREARVRVGRADHPELVRIHAELRLELQADLQRRARVLVLQHRLLFRHAHVEVELVPELVAGELVVRREELVRLAVALDLRHLVERLPLARASSAYSLVIGLPVNESISGNMMPFDRLPLCAIARTSTAGVLLVGLQPLPEILRIVAADRANRRVRLDPPRLVARRRGRSRRDGGCCRPCSRSTRSR